jgi:hypothetical protein
MSRQNVAPLQPQRFVDLALRLSYSSATLRQLMGMMPRLSMPNVR